VRAEPDIAKWRLDVVLDHHTVEERESHEADAPTVDPNLDRRVDREMNLPRIGHLKGSPCGRNGRPVEPRCPGDVDRRRG
jgi:hypothetical protein